MTEAGKLPHGPGQLVVYPLLDLRRRGLGVRQMVNLLEQTCIDLLAHWQINAQASLMPRCVRGRNGERKIASLGLRVRKGCCYHGISINVAMDLAPFRQINPCGYAGPEMAQMVNFSCYRRGERRRAICFCVNSSPGPVFSGDYSMGCALFMTDLNQDSSVHAYDPAEPKAPVKRTRRIAEGEKLRDADKVERIPVKVIASDAPCASPIGSASAYPPPRSGSH